jgi:alpha-tubulin suppressor-like RCC1 family protein
MRRHSVVLVLLVLISLAVLAASAMPAGAAAGGGAAGPAGTSAERLGQNKPLVACGDDHVLAIATDGTLWSWGLNTSGQLGWGSYDTTATAHPTPTQVGSVNTWTTVACGGNFSVGLRSDGTLWTWGDNSQGELGLGTTDTSAHPTPAQVIINKTSYPSAVDNNWVAVACGYYCVVALKTDGTLWSFGLNSAGSLGRTPDAGHPVSLPCQITGCSGGDANWTEIASGYDHSVALKSNGTLWSWGNDYFGQLGQGLTLPDSATHTTPAQVIINKTANPGEVDNLWTAVSCGSHHSVALRADGSVWGWGFNDDGQLGDGTTANQSSPERITAHNTAVTCGGCFTLAIKASGSLWSWGWNGSGQLGRVTSNPSLSLGQVGSAMNWLTVASGESDNFVLGLAADGTLSAWGDNTYGQLGDGTTTQRSAPVIVPRPGASPADDAGWAAHPLRIASGEWAWYSCVVKPNGALLAWGDNAYGQLGLGDHTDRNLPVQVGTGTTWTSVACDWRHTAAIAADGTLWAWGANTEGELGLGDTNSRLVPTQVSAGSTWTAISCGYSQTAAIRNDGTLWAWGGDSTAAGYRTSPEQIGTGTNWTAVACGGEGQTVAIRSDGTLWAWGYNGLGQLGDGTETDRTSPVQIGTATNWTAIACGFAHTVALRSDGTLWSWGLNTSGQLGWGTYDSTAAAHPTPTQVGTGTSWAAVACGDDSTLALRGDGSLYSWGSNDYGQLGLGTFDLNAHPSPTQVSGTWNSIACGGFHSMSTDNRSALWAWGQNSSGQLGDGANPTGQSSPEVIGRLHDVVPPGAPMVTSSTHPSQTTWYAGSTSSFSFPASDSNVANGSITGYSYVLDQSSDTVPDTTRDCPGSTTTYTSAALADGTWCFHVRACDYGYNWGPTTTYTINIDTTAPSGAVAVGNAGGYVNSRTVTVHPTATDLNGPVLEQVRNAGDAWPATWSALGDTSLTLPLGEGYKTVEARYQDAAGNTSQTVSTTVVYDITPPTGWLVVADHAASVNTTSTVYEAYSNDMNGPVLMRIRNGGSPWPTTWTPIPVGDQPLTLPSGDGTKWVDVEFKDAAGNVALLSQSLILDTTPPLGSLAIDGGASYTTDTAATLSLSATDAVGATAVRLRDAVGSWGVWHKLPSSDTNTVSAGTSWTLPTGDATRTVEAQYRDVGGNLSDVAGASIVLDTTAPQTSDNSAGIWHAGPWTLQLTSSDPLAADGSRSGMSGGAAQTQWSTDAGTTWQTGTSVPFSAWKRGGGSGSFSVLYRSSDAAGNLEATKAITVRIDTSKPTSSVVLGAVAGGQATVYLKASDAFSGVASIWYSLDGGSWTQAAYPGDPGLAVTVSGIGAHTLSYYAVDGAGNVQAGYNVNLVAITGSTQASLSDAPSVAVTDPAHAIPHRHARAGRRMHRMRR